LQQSGYDRVFDVAPTDVDLGTLQTMLSEMGVHDPGLFTFVYWLENVMPGVTWDYKKNGGTAYADMMGNFNFGATGNVLISNPTTILSSAGTVQLIANPSGSNGGVPGLIPPYGDDTAGQAQIMDGINGGC